MTTNLDLALRAVELARRAGAEQCDAFLVAYDESNVTVRLGKTEKLIEASSRQLGLRVINGGRTAVCSSSDLSDAALERLARETVELATISAPDEHAGLPEPALLARATVDGLQLYDERLGALTVDEKLGMTTACEQAAFDADGRITNSDGATLSTRAGEISLANSLGFAASYPHTRVSLAVEVMADDADGKKRNAYWYSAERSLHRLLPPEEIGRIAARRAVGQIGARKVPTRQVPIVFEPMMAGRLLGDLASCVTGSALYRQATFLAGRTGERVGSELLTVIDDPSIPAASGSRPFDGEGVTASPRPLFTNGVFEGFLFDSYSARRTGNRSTGSANRGVESSPSPGPSNLVLKGPRTVPVESLLKEIGEGLLVTELIGHGFNPTSGDWSRGAAGYWIENGELAYPVTEVNVSGTLEAMLAGVDAVGDDLTWFGAVAAPTLRIQGMTLSGL
ncbi:MAG: TldD/PmbA family protein [Dehalococcoidia bacterium]|nr:TldD/PmbA family protein [Dehalococcoidia bacterium]